MDLKKMSLEEFLRVNLKVSPASPTGSFLGSVGIVPTSQRPIEGSSVYSFAEIDVGNPQTDIAVVDSSQGTADIVGGYLGDTMRVEPGHEGQDLGARMVLEVAQNRSPVTDRDVSGQGLLTLIKAWKVANGMAQLRDLKKIIIHDSIRAKHHRPLPTRTIN